ncbi:hypothetical protein RSK60_170009 [Ralstonia solanacearum K60]|nr:hypothetical protein RSK60_170009 [Ralstonia solanacearum K60]
MAVTQELVPQDVKVPINYCRQHRRQRGGFNTE